MQSSEGTSVVSIVQKATASSPLPDNDIHDKIGVSFVFETACGPCGRESLGSTEYGVRIGIYEW